MENLLFKSNESILTLGAEMEIQLLDRDSHLLVPRAPELLSYLDHDQLTKEMFRSTLEIITHVCQDASAIEKDLKSTLKEVRAAGAKLHLCFAGTGTNPVSKYEERQLSGSPRYQLLLDRNQWLIKRMAVYGLHIHLAMPDGDTCIRYNNFFLQFMPHLIALSASSPYWAGQDTGLDASRPTVYEAHPTAGRPIIVQNWAEFNILYNLLLKTHSIQSMKDIWWDLRPSPGYGTLEIRICDGPATMSELIALTAWIHLLANWFRDHEEEFYMNNNPRPEVWIMRENKWRSIRYGLDASLISYETFEEHSLRENIHYWIDKLDPYIRHFGYEPQVETIQWLLNHGNSATRQRRVYVASNDMMEVVRHNIREFELGKPIWP